MNDYVKILKEVCSKEELLRACDCTPLKKGYIRLSAMFAHHERYEETLIRTLHERFFSKSLLGNKIYFLAKIDFTL